MRSRALLIGLVAALVAVAAYFWRERSISQTSDDEPAPSAATGGTAPKATSPSAAAAGDDDSAGGADAADEDGDAASRPRERPEPRNHVGAEATHPRKPRPGQRTYVVQVPIIKDLRKALKPAVEACSAKFSEGLAAGATIQGALDVTIRAGVLSVLDVKVEHRGVPEASGLIECARKEFAAVTLPATGHADVERHTLRFPFRVPLK
jgi:hypothetical protein